MAFTAFDAPISFDAAIPFDGQASSGHGGGGVAAPNFSGLAGMTAARIRKWLAKQERKQSSEYNEQPRKYTQTRTPRRFTTIGTGKVSVGGESPTEFLPARRPAVFRHESDDVISIFGGATSRFLVPVLFAATDPAVFSVTGGSKTVFADMKKIKQEDERFLAAMLAVSIMED